MAPRHAPHPGVRRRVHGDQAADQAEAVFLLVSGRLGKTTGQILTVDGGLTDAFLR